MSDQKKLPDRLDLVHSIMGALEGDGSTEYLPDMTRYEVARHAVDALVAAGWVEVR